MSKQQEENQLEAYLNNKSVKEYLKNHEQKLRDNNLSKIDYLILKIEKIENLLLKFIKI